MRRLAIGIVLVVVGASCGWARPRYDAGNSGNNPLEQTVSAANVATLVPQFVAASATLSTVPTFVVARGHLYVSGSPLRAYDAGGHAACEDGSPRICSPQWSLDTFGEPDVIGTTLYRGGNAYDADGVAGCSGAPKMCVQMWQEGIGNAPPRPTNPDALHFGALRLFGHGGEMVSMYGYDVPCAPTPAPCPLRWAASLGTGASGGTIGTAAVAAGRVFATYSPVGQHGTLFAFDGNSGTAPELWSAALDGVSGSAIAAAAGVVVVQVQTASGARLEAFDAEGKTNCSGAPKTCQPIWSTDPWAGPGGDAAPAIANGKVYRAVGTQLRGYDLGQSHCTGSPKVCTPTWTAFVGPTATAPAVANGLVFTTASDGTVEAFDGSGVDQCSATTHVCAALWDTNIGAAAGAIEVADGRVYVAAGNGTVTAYGLPPG